MGLGPNTSSSQDPSLSDAAKILFPKKLKVIALMWFYFFWGGSHSAHYKGCLLAVVRTSQHHGTGLGEPMKMLVAQSCPTVCNPMD